jgi:probable selenium-dependent hydroxylase accessory protein YqeC
MITLRKAFQISDREIISIVGAGGKTTLMFALAGELIADGARVITTTTTKIFPPTTSQSPATLLHQDRECLLRKAAEALRKNNHITVASEKLDNGKLNGISPEVTEDLTKLCNYLIIEADGSSQHPLKAPNETEPVIPESTTLVIPVIGLEAIGQAANDETVFRLPLFLKLTGLKAGDIITEKAVAKLFTSPEGIIKNSPVSARIIPLLNKVDTLDGFTKGRLLAKEILAAKHHQITRVVLGQVKMKPPVIDILTML